MLAQGSPHPFSPLCVPQCLLTQAHNNPSLLAPFPSPLLALCPLVISLLSPSLGSFLTSLVSAYPSCFSTPSAVLCSVVHTFLNSP